MNRDGYRDQIVTHDVSVSLHSKTHPLFMKYNNGTSTVLCISLSKLVSCAFSTIPILIPRIFHLLVYITGYGSTLYIGIAMVFVFSPYIWKFTFCFQFQVNLTFNDFTAQNMSKVISVPNIS